MSRHLLTTAALLAVRALAQQTAGAPFVPLDGVTNNASYLPGCATNGGVAQGSLFAVFGREIGPSTLAQVRAFPLNTSLAACRSASR